jgi:hypothetical protein
MLASMAPIRRLLLSWALTLLGACAGPRPAPTPRPAPPTPAQPALPNTPGPAWPLVHPGVESRYISSFDRTGRNADGFTGKYSSLYTLPGGEHVIFDALGPGVLNTLWFTGPEEGGRGLALGAIRFYFDDEKSPRIETDVPRLFGGRQPPFVKPLVADNRQSTGGFVSWVPLPYRRRLIVTTERRPSFYIAQYDTHPADAPLESWRPTTDTPRLGALFAAALRGLSRRPLREVPLEYRHRGAGTIEAIRFQPAAPASAEQLARARIQIRWDGASTPDVDVPLGMFFGTGLGEAPVRAVAFTVQDGVFENRLPMPFWRGFQLRVTGLPGSLRMALGPPRYPENDAGHLHAIYREASPTTPDEDFEWIDLEGAGKLVGTVLTIRPPTPETKRWWEGDLRSYVDGRRTPGLHGTGHEDDHLGGWSNTFFERPFSLPMHGEPKVKMIERQGEQYNAETTLYRLWPGINFSGAIRHSVEHGSENRVQASYAGVAFLYLQRRGPRLTQTDQVDLGDADSRRSHGFAVEGELALERLASAFEGRAYRTVVEGAVASHTGPARFTLRAIPANRGCWLRRAYDQRHGRQRARISVDGRHLADWYVAEGNPVLRWAERGLFLPPRLTAGRSALKLEVRPAPGVPWSAASYRLLCVRP